MMSEEYKMQAPRQKPWMSTLRTLDWGLPTPKEIGSGSRGSPKKIGPFPKRAPVARKTPIPVMIHICKLGLSFKSPEKNQNQVTGKRANAA
jgi:hypothetical protein